MSYFGVFSVNNWWSCFVATASVILFVALVVNYLKNLRDPPELSNLEDMLNLHKDKVEVYFNRCKLSDVDQFLLDFSSRYVLKKSGSNRLADFPVLISFPDGSVTFTLAQDSKDLTLFWILDLRSNRLPAISYFKSKYLENLTAGNYVNGNGCFE